MNNLFVGVDLGGTNIEIAIMNGESISRLSFPTDTTHNGRNIIPDIAKHIQEYADNNTGVIRAVGLAIPGVIDDSGYTEICVNLNWHKKNVIKEFKDYLDTNVYVMNDANASALGEYYYGLAKGFPNSMTITLGTGVGSGLILNHQIHQGSHALAGEFGHIHIETDQKTTCPCGGQNCLETYVSKSGLERQVSEPITVKEMFDLAKGGDEQYRSLLEKNFKHLSHAILNLYVVLDLDLVVISGGISNAGDFLLELITQEMVKYKPDYLPTPIVKQSRLIEDAGVMGMLGYVKEKESL
ncbi:ROK family protein [Erysipelothrix urinaevulpis]|uniref:ROK family protein n=1 Tax=Erysipelothrix urinaevulpis TaxID=2683717 RepID=UPI0013590EE7|nr:ROK family protein [Erysipelothrix urinaevulpis]